MELLKKLDTNAIFPITSLSSHVLVVTIGLSFFHDKISLIQFIGIAVTFIVVGFYNNLHKHITFKNGLIPITSALVLLSATTKFIQKFGSVTVELRNFIFWQLFFAMIASFVILLIVNRENLKEKISVSKQIIWWSIALGVCNFIGTVEIVKALSTGPFSLVYTINSFYILITSVIAWKFFGEKLTKHKVIFLLISIVTVILIGLG
jgi:drug/metabolite transporter (DMT)-like permease